MEYNSKIMIAMPIKRTVLNIFALFLFVITATNCSGISPLNFFSGNISDINLSKEKFITYGDSITAQGQWQPFLLSYFQINDFCNMGENSSSLAYNLENENKHKCFVNAERLNGLVSKKPDLLTILGGTNDAHLGVDLGTKNELTKSFRNKNINCFYGAYSYLIEFIKLHNPKVKIILLTCLHSFLENQYDYKPFVKATKDIASFYNVSFVDLYNLSGIDNTNFNKYTIDWLHPNSDGGILIARLIALEIENIYAHKGNH